MMPGYFWRMLRYDEAVKKGGGANGVHRVRASRWWYSPPPLNEVKDGYWREPTDW